MKTRRQSRKLVRGGVLTTTLERPYNLGVDRGADAIAKAGIEVHSSVTETESSSACPSDHKVNHQVTRLR